MTSQLLSDLQTLRDQPSGDLHHVPQAHHQSEQHYAE